jgi:hypothetical protein
MSRQYAVDEHGRMIGFTLDDEDCPEIGPYGDGLSVGDSVICDDGEYGVIAKIYSYIQTGPPGVSNYVAVDIDIDES